jgi:hypothetical protein
MQPKSIAKGLRVLALAAVTLAVVPLALADAVYRWKDAQGRVNYGNLPPPGVKAELLDRGTMSVAPAPVMVPRPPAESVESARRLDRLEAELEEERRLRLEAEQRADEGAERRERARAECEAQFREPCDDEGRPVGPRYIVVPGRPVWHHPGGRPPHPPAAPPKFPRGDDMAKPVLPIESGRSARQPLRPSDRPYSGVRMWPAPYSDAERDRR